MWLSGLLLVLGLVLLAKGADSMVEYSARAAKRVGVSDFIIGLTITSIGTSVPELAASTSASLQGSSGLVIGNVVGSNIANIGLIVGVAAVYAKLWLPRAVLQRDGLVMLAAVVLFFGLALDNGIARWEGITFLILYVLFIVFAVRSDRERREVQFQDFVRYVFEFSLVDTFVSRIRLPHRGAGSDEAEGLPPASPDDADRPPPPGEAEPDNEGDGEGEETSSEGGPAKGGNVVTDILLSLLSLGAVILGARWLVSEATFFARQLSIPETFIGLTIVSVGTSVPELVVSVAAARKGRGGIVVGNVLGSNIANILLILGVASTISPLEVAEQSVVNTIPVMLFFSVLLVQWAALAPLARAAGGVLLTSYASFIAVAYALGW